MPTPLGPYSTVLVEGNLVFVSGQIPFDAEGNLVGEEFNLQAHQVFRNMEASLAAARCSFEDVLKVTAYLSNFADFEVYNEVYSSYFQKPYPARTTVQVGLYGFKIEIDAIARRP